MQSIKRLLTRKSLIWSSLLMIILAPLLGLVACTGDQPYRTSLADLSATTGEPSGSICARQWNNPVALDPANLAPGDAPNKETHWGAGKEWTCALQKHEVRSRPNMTSTPKAGSASPDKSDADRRSYHLAFLEFGEDGRFATDPEIKKIHEGQLRDLRLHLSRQKQNYLIVFVHGWRHGANKSDDDIKDLRLMAAYARSFLNQRCDELGRYCDASVTALYVGWRGASVDESYGAVTTPAALLSLFNRKPQSELVAASVVDKLDRVWSELLVRNTSKDTSEFEKNRMLVIGHSLGGNMLLSGLSPKIIDNINVHKPNDVMPSPLGDLVVLLNPAAEAPKWIALQNAVHQKDAALNLIDENERRRAALFRQDQKPIIISLTSACGLKLDDGSRGTTDTLCDQATSFAFPLYRMALGNFLASERNTIGHMPISVSSEVGVTPGSTVGPTHQFDINFTTGTTTRYSAALDKRLSRCDFVDGWLSKVRAENPPFGRGWDAGFSNIDGNPVAVGGRLIKNETPINSNYNEPRGPKRLESQFRHGITLYNSPEQRAFRPSSSGHDPFWNVKAHVGAISQHNGYVSYQTWCAINQFVMDNVTTIK